MNNKPSYYFAILLGEQTFQSLNSFKIFFFVRVIRQMFYDTPQFILISIPFVFHALPFLLFLFPCTYYLPFNLFYINMKALTYLIRITDKNITDTAFFYHTFVNSTKSSVIHLIRAVKHNDVFCQTFAHVFDCFSFSCSSWASRRTSHVHANRLSQSYIAPGIGKHIGYCAIYSFQVTFE